MKTDVPLKRLTALCAADVLPWLGIPLTDILGVRTLELPASAKRLDNVILFQTADGRPGLHLIEWQGYPDPTVLWRCLSYLAWLGATYPDRLIRCSVIYLNREADAGDQVGQHGAPGDWAVQFHTIRLWEHPAQAALDSGRPGLLALTPLLAGATPELAETAVQRLLTEASPAIQNELLAALGMLAEPLLDTERFLRLVTKERLMQTDLITYLMKDKELAFAAEKATLEARLAAEAQREVALLQEKASLEERLAAQAQANLEERLAAEAAQREAALRSSLQQAVEDAIIARFPLAPAALTRRIRAISDPAQLQSLIPAVITAPDLTAVEALLG